MEAGDGVSECVSGPGHFEYGPVRANKLAERLAMELSGELRAPDTEYQRIERDLALLLSTYPALGTLTVYPAKSPDRLAARVNPDQSLDGFHALNAFYQVVSIREYEFAPGLYLLSYCDAVHAAVLATSYRTLPEVIYAEPDWAGGDGDRVNAAVEGPDYVYRFSNGEGDCLSGCLYRQTWIFSVNPGGAITMQSYSPGPCGVGLPNDGDWDGDAIVDCLDPCPLHNDAVPTDADSDGVFDSCDNCALANPDQRDCQLNSVGDPCDIAGGASGDCNANGVPDECDRPSAPHATPMLSAGRYLPVSIPAPCTPNTAGFDVAIRVTFVSLPGAFSRWDGLRLWAGEPEVVSEAAAVVRPSDARASPAFVAGRLGCVPHCRSDWHMFEALHLLHEGIVGQGLYRIQAVHCHHDLSQEQAYSPGLVLTMPAGGDCCGPPAGEDWPGPDGHVDLGVDVAGVLAKFSNQLGSPNKARVDIAPATPDYRVDIVDVTWFVDAFRGTAAPEAPRAGTPCG